MGKATITAGGPDGSYTIDLDFGGAVRTAKIDKLTKFITDTQTSIEKEQVEADKDKTKEDAQQALVTSYLNSYVAMANAAAASGIPADPKAFNFELTKLIQMRAAHAPRKLKLQQLKSAKAQAEKDRAYWQGLQLTETRQAWCVDFTEDAAGVVDTLDVPGESELILIAGGGAAPNDGGGQLTAREVQSPEQVFFNAAILPGWQKWRPTYRTGVITALYADDTADVKLDDAKSSAQGLSINQTSTLKAVPVQYMDCNSAAFEVDDKCVIRFDGQNWETPKVIGFVSNPKPCNWPCIYGFEDWYQYFFQNKLSESQPLTMSELMFTGASVQARENRGAWANMAFAGYFDLGGGNRYNQFLYRFDEGAGYATLLVGYGFVLGWPGQLATLFDGVWLIPPLKARAADQPVDVPMVHEFRITIAGEVKFNAAIYSNRGTGFITNKVGRVRAKGGIQLVPISMPVLPLDYALGD